MGAKRFLDAAAERARIPAMAESRCPSQEDVPRLVDLARRSLAVLRLVEWEGRASVYNDPNCPRCDRAKDLGHTADCELVATIAALEAEDSDNG